MKPISSILSALLLMPLAVLAQGPEGPPPGGPDGPRHGRPEGPPPAEIIAKFDKDGDGKLSEDERAAMKEARKTMMEARKKEILAQFDKDGDGKLNDEEKAAAKEARQKLMLEKFDKDGDGKLSKEEKEAARAEFGGPGGPGGHGGPEKHKGKGSKE